MAQAPSKLEGEPIPGQASHSEKTERVRGEPMCWGRGGALRKEAGHLFSSFLAKVSFAPKYHFARNLY